MSAPSDPFDGVIENLREARAEATKHGADLQRWWSMLTNEYANALRQSANIANKRLIEFAIRIVDVTTSEKSGVGGSVKVSIVGGQQGYGPARKLPDLSFVLQSDGTISARGKIGQNDFAPAAISLDDPDGCPKAVSILAAYIEGLVKHGMAV